MGLDETRIRHTAHPQRTPKSAASHRLSETCWIEMQMCTPAGPFVSRIGDDVDDPGRFTGLGNYPGDSDDSQ